MELDTTMFIDASIWNDPVRQQRLANIIMVTQKQPLMVYPSL